jgi:hypothetical protein
MKIRDLLIQEYQTGNIGKPGNVTTPGPQGAGMDPAAMAQQAVAMRPSVDPAKPASTTAPQKPPAKPAAKKDPQVLARQQELIKAGAKIKADGIMGPATRAAEQQFGPAVDAAKGSQTAGNATTITNPAQATQTAQQATPATPAPTPAVTPPPEKNALGVTAQSSNPAFGAPQPQADAPTPPEAAPAPAPAKPDSGRGYAPAQQGQGGYAQSATAADGQPTQAQPGVNTDTGLSTVPGQVTTGTGGTTNLTTASQDEYAWRAKNPNWNMTGAQYPGAGKWDPSTGRTKRESIEYHEKDNRLLQQMLRIAGLR